MARVRLTKAQLTKDTPSTPTRSAYNAFPSSPRSKSPSKRHARPVLYGTNGSVLSQRNLPTPMGQFGFLERPHIDINRPSTPPPRTPSPGDSSSQTPLTPHGRKRLAQQLRWENEVLPVLVQPYMEYLRVSLNLSQDVELPRVNDCTCMNRRERVLEMVVLRFSSESLALVFIIILTMLQELQKLSLRVCQCRPAALQLMNRGLFGNAPKEPTLAVDLRVLDFVTRLFLRLSPNNTAICQTIEDFLRSQGYQLRGQVS